MDDRLREKIEALGMNEEDFKPKDIFAEVKALKAEMAELKSYVNALGKTELQGDGSADKPFTLVVGMELVPNAYYSYNDKRYVYMGSEPTATAENMPTGDSDADFEKGWTEF